MKKIAVAGFQHETNTFASRKADFLAFEIAKDWPGLCVGDEVFEKTRGFNLPITGAIDSLTAQQFQIVPLCWAFAVPCGVVTREAYERIATMMLDALGEADGIAGVYLDLHGAMVTEHFDDAEGELLRRVRMRVGSEVPVVASLDYHANITEQMVEYADYLDVYRQYPHTDMTETGRRAADVLGHLIREENRFLKLLVKSDYLIPLSLGCTTQEPCLSLLFRDLATIRAALPRGCHISFAAGFALSDIEEAGPAIVAYGLKIEAIQQAVDDFKQCLDLAEAGFSEPGLPARRAVEQAIEISRTALRPVVLADAQDNPGAGGTGDTTGLLRHLVECGAENAVIGFIADAQAANMAVQEGVGATIEIGIGGKEFAGDTPFYGTFRVLALGNGQVVGTGPMWRGARMQLGPCALLEQGGVKIAISSRTVQTGDTALFRHLGVELERMSIIAVKSSVHFRADFEPLAERVLLALSPGPVIADPRELPYRKLRKHVRIGPNMALRDAVRDTVT